MPHQLWFTAILNKLFGGVVTWVLLALGLHPEYPQAPIPNFVAMQVLIVLFLLAVFLGLRSRLSVENPSSLQHVFEGLRGFVQNQSREIIGHHSEGFTPFLLCLGLFILAGNLMGMIPSLESPTETPNVPLGLAVTAFLYYHWQGIRRLGPLKYVKTFMGPVLLLAPLMMPIELISHCARILSLTVRLWANMFAGELVGLVFFSMIPIGIPVIFMGLHIFVSFLQAYIFVLLTTVYLQGAVSEEH